MLPQFQIRRFIERR